MSDSNPLSRRHFFQGALLAGAVPTAGFGSVASLKHLGYKSPNEKMNLAAIGAGGKGYSDIKGICATENLVAMADPDEKRAARSFTEFPNVPKFKDFRQMLDKEGKNIDAVNVSIPDHMHATASIWAMQRGKHVYCQKPLTRTVWEAQEMLRVSKETGVATQMGNQGYSNEGARQACEMVWNGDIGGVTEVHAWTDRPGRYWPQGPEVVQKEEPIPSTFDWDLWLGVAAARPYSSAYAPHHWRGYPDFGCGAIGDMACHILGTPNMALKLGNPVSVECETKEGTSPLMFPHKTRIRFDFPARGSMPALKLYWHDSLKAQPEIPGVPAGELLGDKGMLTTGCYGERTRLIPAEKMKDYTLPAPLLTRSPGHYRDFIRACKGGDPACSNFSVAAPFVSWMLLGSIAMRFEGKLQWDSAKMRFTNNNEANKYLKPAFRKGWGWGKSTS